MSWLSKINQKLDNEKTVGYCFSIPILLYFLGFMIGPMLFAIYLSFHNWGGFEPLALAQFVGLDNFRSLLFHNKRFIKVFINTFYFSAGSVISLTVTGLVLALVIERLRRFVGFARTLFFIPCIMSMTAVSLVWTRTLLQPAYGLINQILGVLGLPSQAFLQDTRQALPSIVGVMIWKWTGFYMVIFLAGLLGIPQVYYDAAAVDGANVWTQFFHITLPLLKPTMLFALVINAIGSFQIFVPIYMMTQGEPADATNTVVYYMYDTAFGFIKFSYATAMAVILLIVILGLTIGQIRLFRKGGMTEW